MTKLVDELLSQVEPSEILERGGLFSKLKKQLVERVLQSELENQLGYSKHRKSEKKSSNIRNGSYNKTIIEMQKKRVRYMFQEIEMVNVSHNWYLKELRRFKKFDDQV